MSYVTKKPNKQRQKESSKISTTSKTLSLPISTWAAIEQVRQAINQPTFETAVTAVFEEKYQALGFGLP